MSVADILVYALSVYLTFHLASRADLFKAPRKWFLKVAPSWLSYPLSCALCWSFWTGAILTLVLSAVTGKLVISAAILFAVPVINMVLDLVVRALIRVNEPLMVSVQTQDSLPSFRLYNGMKSDVVLDHCLSNVKIGDAVTLTSLNPGIPHWADKLPDPSHVGRRVAGPRGNGLIQKQFIHGDDCSNHFGRLMYGILLDNGTHCDERADTCIVFPEHS